LPPVELSARGQIEIDGVLARLCDEYTDAMIGTLSVSPNAVRRVMAG
jgi:hypothetical protein